MKLLVSLILFIAGAQITPPTIVPTTWYIRSDGGNLSQCTGQTDAAYVAGMATKNCALNDYRLLAFSGTYTATMPVWRVQGGDTIRIHAGQYRLGYNGPNSADHNGLAIAGNPFASAMPPIPSGTAASPTKIIGDGSATTQLYGGYGAGNVISLSGSAFVQISGLELTDHGQCTRVGAGYAAPVIGCNAAYPLSDYAAVGIYTNTGTHDVTLTDLNIHGFTSDGIRGPIGGLVTVSHVRIGFNASAGWDFDNGSGTPSVNNATVIADHLTVEGSGCNEEYPIVHPGFPASSCFDQNSGGYGDGIGTPGTPLNFTCDQCLFRYNTQDGPDLLHTSGSVYKVTNSQSYGNMGQQWKLGAMASVDFEHNQTVHNCERMSKPMAGNSTYFKYLSNFCRAGGDGIAMVINDASVYTIKNNSYAGYGATSYDISCSTNCTKPVITYENNLNIGYTQPIAGGQKPGVFYYEMPYSPFVAQDNNIFYQMRTCPTGGICTDPHIAVEPTDVQVTADETVLDNIDFHVASSTGAYGGAVVQPVTFTLTCTQTGAAISCATK
jgi:hypothetical protein